VRSTSDQEHRDQDRNLQSQDWSGDQSHGLESTSLVWSSGTWSAKKEMKGIHDVETRSTHDKTKGQAALCGTEMDAEMEDKITEL